MLASGRTATNCHGRQPASTTNVSISVIFTLVLPIGRPTTQKKRWSPPSTWMRSPVM